MAARLRSPTSTTLSGVTGKRYQSAWSVVRIDPVRWSVPPIGSAVVQARLGWSANTRTTNVRVVVWLVELVTEQVTCVSPTANTEPEAGEHDGVSGPSYSSLAETAYSTAVPSSVVVASTGAVGTVSVGGCGSRKRPCARPLPLSAALR